MDSVSAKVYLDKNVYEATLERLEFCLNNFKTVILSFSGGKDSGLLLQILLDYIKAYGIDKDRVFVYYQNNEANLQSTDEFVDRMLDKCWAEGYKNVYHFCQPFALRNAVSMYELHWFPFDPEKEDAWVSRPPDKPYVYTMDRHVLEGYWSPGQGYHEHAKAFGRFVRDLTKGPVCQLLGVRADESLQRYSGIVNKVEDFKGQMWITSVAKDVWSASPIYDWTLEDVWHAHAAFGYDYNKVYDLMYKAGVAVGNMRVASPFNDAAKATLNVFRVLEPRTWGRLVNRVSGANFASIYAGTKAMGKNLQLPPRFRTWRAYEKFLLATFPEETRRHFIRHFITSVKFWNRVGAGLEEDVIAKLQAAGYHLRFNGFSPYSKGHRLRRVCILGRTPDDISDVIPGNTCPSHKRNCLALMRIDIPCTTLGFGLPAADMKKIKFVKENGQAMMAAAAKMSADTEER